MKKIVQVFLGILLLFPLVQIGGQSVSSAENINEEALSSLDSSINLTAKAGNTKVDLIWNKVEGDGIMYIIQRSTVNGGPYTVIGRSPNLAYRNNRLDNGTTYYYIVTATGTDGETHSSNQISVTPSDIPNPSVPPTDLIAKPSNSHAVLRWKAPEGVFYFNIKRSTDPEGPYTNHGSVYGSNWIRDYEYRDYDLDNGTTYYYKVTSDSAGWESEPSAAVSVVPMPPLPAPNGLTSITGDGNVTISWNAVPGASSYDVKRSTEDGRSYEVIAKSVTETLYTDTLVSNGVRYYYVVSAERGTATGSANSASVHAVPAPEDGSPAIPTGIEVTAGDGQVILSWPAVSGADSYKIKRGAFDSAEYEVIASNVRAPMFQDTGVENGVTYDYVVSAVNEHGESYDSKPYAVTPADVAVVAQDGSGDYTTVLEAINAAPDHSDKRHVIFIKNGVYHDRLGVPAAKRNLSLVGESKEGTVLISHDYKNTENSLGRTYSIKIVADDFILKNLTIQNDSGPNVREGIAAEIEGDRAYLENVRFLGDVVTLVADRGRQYYKACYVEGVRKVISGTSMAVFDDCEIHTKGDGEYLFYWGYTYYQPLPGRIRPYSYAFLNSKITADEGIEKVMVYSRDRWGEYSSRIAFINSFMDAPIEPYSFYGGVEFNTQGRGAYAKRDYVTQILPEEANDYTVQNLLRGSDGWNPARTGVIPVMADSAPVLTVNQQDAIVKESSFTVSGQVDKEVTVTVNGTVIPLEPDLTFETAFELQPGENTITVEAVDVEGRMAMPVILKVVYDNIAPVIMIDGPEGKKAGNHYNTGYNRYPVSGRLSEAGTVWINGKEVEVSEALTFHAEVGLEPGLNEITVTAIDVAGNSSDPETFHVVPTGSASNQ
ncbi:pectinesterase family protein [Paenibacillus tarimensis]